ncbi:MAG: DegT/DnrJ/EryC1/StrS family aminotransferase [Marinirhabdus sp.]|nr:DegT/DnrJ/EryC1/StrS family aminotransferase [Marinirhabdus sp.]
MKSKIYLSSPHMGGAEQKFVAEAFDTNWIAPLGPNVIGFEEDLEKYLDNGSSVAALSSGTAAIHLALILLGVKSEDEVLCQSFTFSASANPIIYQGATPIFIDSEPETWNMCPIRLEEAIEDRIKKGKRPKAIIAVHLYGMPCKIEEINKVSRKFDIPVIEDSAEALGSTYRNQPCGTFGDLGVLSFNGNKIITTSGGGALVTKEKHQKKKAVFLATQARDSAPHYQHSEIGYNYRLSNICAGIGRGQMQVLDDHVDLRRQMHVFYKRLFKSTKGISVFEEPSADYFSNHWLSCILLDPDTVDFSTETIRLALDEENIESRPLWKPMHLQPVFKNAPYYGSTIAETLFHNGLCLPSGSNLTSAEKERIERALQPFL